jgi:hypothetical protein
MKHGAFINEQEDADAFIDDLAEIKLGQDLASLRKYFLQGEYLNAREFIEKRISVSSHSPP